MRHAPDMHQEPIPPHSRAAHRRAVAELHNVVAAECAQVRGALSAFGMDSARCGSSQVFIGIDVEPDGRLAVTLWRGSRRDSTYACVDKAQALARVLPQAIDEAIALLQGVASPTSEAGVRDAA